MFNQYNLTMKNLTRTSLAGLLFILFVGSPQIIIGQNDKVFAKKYFNKIDIASIDESQQKYRMTAIYTNKDLYGKFMDKTKVIGDYTRGLGDGNVKWNNVYISTSTDVNEPFNSEIKLDYIENITYVPSDDMLNPERFVNFPPSAEAVYARNLIWDMMAIEGFAWDHLDSLKLNKTYLIPGITDEFQMADVGTYSHAAVQLCWTGISIIDNDFYAILEYEALDNIVNITMPNIKTKGTEQYWGTILISLKTREIGSAIMSSGSMQEIEITGMENKLLIKTIRELKLEKLE
jgi:hypothetical protein